MTERSRRVPVVRMARTGASAAEERVVAECPLLIRVDEEVFASIMLTPGDEVELAVGQLLSEGVITSRADCAAITHRRDLTPEEVSVRLAGGTNVRRSASAAPWLENGEPRDPLALVRARLKDCCRAAVSVDRAMLAGLLARMVPLQTLRRETNGTHAMALFDERGGLVAFAEDVGRFNALDKVIGRALLAGSLADCRICLASSRASFGVVRKAAAARIAILAAMSAPTSPAIELAEEAGMTLIGLLREDSFRVYAGAGRVRG